MKRHNFHCKTNFASHRLENREWTFPSFVGGCRIAHYCLQRPLSVPLCFRWKLWKRHTSGGCWMRLRSPPSRSCAPNNRPTNRPVSTTKKFLPTWELPSPDFYICSHLHLPALYRESFKNSGANRRPVWSSGRGLGWPRKCTGDGGCNTEVLSCWDGEDLGFQTPQCVQWGGGWQMGHGGTYISLLIPRPRLTSWLCSKVVLFGSTSSPPSFPRLYSMFLSVGCTSATGVGQLGSSSQLS